MGKHAFEIEKSYWEQLSSILGIDYLPHPDAKGSWQHRLIGYIKGFLVVVKYSQLPQVNFPVYGVLVRFSPLADPKRIEQALLENPEITEIRGKLKAYPSAFEIQENYAWIAIRYNYKKDSASEIAEKIFKFINLLSTNVCRLPTEICESKDCKSRPNYQTSLVFVNEFPQFLCNTCIAEIPKKGEKAQEEFQNAPTSLLQGIAGGLVTVLIGGIIWALVAVFLKRITAILAALMFAGVINVMDKVGTKRTIWSVLSAAFLSVGGVIFGSYLTIIFYNIKEYSAEVSMGLFVRAWQHLWSNPGVLFLPLFFYALGVLPYLWIVWSNTGRYLSMAFNPKVEIIDEHF